MAQNQENVPFLTSGRNTRKADPDPNGYLKNRPLKIFLKGWLPVNAGNTRVVFCRVEIRMLRLTLF